MPAGGVALHVIYIGFGFVESRQMILIFYH